MKRSHPIRARGLVALVLIVASAPVFAVAFGADTAAGAREAKQERYLYVATIARFDVDERTGKLTSSTPGGSSWVSFENVRKRTTTGPRGRT